jgi:hypothetical protein
MPTGQALGRQLALLGQQPPYQGISPRLTTAESTPLVLFYYF